MGDLAGSVGLFPTVTRQGCNGRRLWAAQIIMTSGHEMNEMAIDKN